MKIIDLCKTTKKLTKRQLDDLLLGFNCSNADINLEKIFDHDGKLIKKNIKHLYVIKNTIIPHRTNGPAIIMNDGSELWMRYGALHRESGKAIVGSFMFDDCQDEEYFLYGRCFEIKEYLKILDKENMVNYL